MKAHRSTQVRGSNEPQNSNFKAGTALENLRAELIDIAALARAAEAAADALPTPANDRQRLLFGRIQSLATKTSQQASASLRFATRRAPRSPRSSRHAGARPVTEVPTGTRIPGTAALRNAQVTGHARPTWDQQSGWDRSRVRRRTAAEQLEPAPSTSRAEAARRNAGGAANSFLRDPDRNQINPKRSLHAGRWAVSGPSWSTWSISAGQSQARPRGLPCSWRCRMRRSWWSLVGCAARPSDYMFA